MLTPYLRLERAASRPLDDGAWKPACESDAASRLQRPTRTPVQPAGMEARQRVERCAARVRAEREDRLETRQNWCPAEGSNPDQKFTKLLHCHCASRAGVDTRCCPEIYAVTKRRPAVERYPPSEWSRAPESNRTERLCRPRHSRSSIATCWHAPKDLNPDCGGWSSECCHYTRDA